MASKKVETAKYEKSESKAVKAAEKKTEGTARDMMKSSHASKK